MKLDAKSVLIPALKLFIICLFVTALLALTNELTKETIAQGVLLAEQESRLIVLPEASSFEESEDGTYYIGYNGDEVVGYVFSTSANGYGGAVSVMTGIDVNSEITGVTIVSHSETPGLGSNAENESFTNQFMQTATELSVIKNATAGDGEIEALTGATITTTAVTDAVNIAIEIYENIEGGE